MDERIQKILSACGYGSRRAMERYITEGRVTVNGQVATLGERADLAVDEIKVDGTPVERPQQTICLMLNKPRGFVTTCSDECGRRTVAQLVADCGRRVWPVGRLDMDSEGLLLMTDDGTLTNLLTHPSHEIEKEYMVWVLGDVENAELRLKEPMYLDGVQLKRPVISVCGKQPDETTLLSITIHEGKNRQIRRMCAQAGLTVVRLKRVREGNLRLDRGLKPGQWRLLTDEELQRITK